MSDRWTNPKLGARYDPHDPLAPDGVEDIDRAGLERELREEVRGEVRFDAGHRAIYSHDSSNYRQIPIGVTSRKSATASRLHPTPRPTHTPPSAG